MNKEKMRMKTESSAMRMLKKMGFEGVAWALRRIHCPVSKEALVLEVGAGGNPYPRANVLLDGYEDSVERIEKSLVSDRPLVLGFAERLPFKSKSFDFVIASHVLEHSANPEQFLRELMRVGKAGYIETPDAFFERINPFTYHRLEVAAINEGKKIRLFKKASWRPDEFIVDEFERQMKDRSFIKYISRHPAPFHMRFYWQDKIDFEVVNPQVDCGWTLPEEAYRKSAALPSPSVLLRLRYGIRNAFRWLFSQNDRNRQIDVYALLACPTCGREELKKTDAGIMCGHCGVEYPIKNGVPLMFPKDGGVAG